MTDIGPSMSLSSVSETAKLRAAVAYLVHRLGGEVYIPSDVVRSFGTDYPKYEVKAVYDENSQRGYKAWETPGIPLQTRVDQAAYLLRPRPEYESDGWEIERVQWLLTNGVEGHPHHDKMGAMQ